MYVRNAVIRLREQNREIEVTETPEELKALLAAAATANQPYIEVTVSREDTQFLSPTPINTKPEKKLVSRKFVVMLANIVLIEDGLADAPNMFQLFQN
jgi:mRNA degradation ribonuclease J1/J2